ncbi:MAG TPA: hypothetical protein PLT64_02490 [Syntrophales bacterium]|nr:hypothetical protein [Syntrophales bacterium]HOL58720.1 hypothetical protein [Syntrophales bacterium]HPO34992.1 hypothetical protein [Syntrophales bacterium]
MSSQFIKDLRVLAGPQAYEIIKDGGLNFDDIGVYFGAAVGPRWLIASGFDLTLLRYEVLGKRRPVLLIGASAGAWRLSTWTMPEAENSYRALMEAYISATYTDKDTPQTIKKSLEHVIDQAIRDDAIYLALKHPRYRLAIITAKAKHLTSFASKIIQGTGFGLCYLLNMVSPSAIFAFVDRVIFFSGPHPPPCESGYVVPLSPANFKPALLASGAIPLVVAGVRNIWGAPPGTYRDGGLTDYQLNSAFPPEAEVGLTLCFLHQAAIIPRWLDKKLDRRPDPKRVKKTILVVPSAEFIARLPEGKVPERDDFIHYLSDPERRMRNWREAVRCSSHLGEVFMELVESGKIKSVVEPIPLK